MALVHLRIAGRDLAADSRSTILAAARLAGIYIPALCSHPDLPAAGSTFGAPSIFRGEEHLESDAPDARWDGCGVCAVEIEGRSEPVRACAACVEDGMQVRVESEPLTAHRRRKLAELFATHPHACLTCAQRQGCSRTQCSSNVPAEERCCDLLGSCELQRIAEHIELPRDLPRYRPPVAPALGAEPLFAWQPALCIGCLRCVRACGDLRQVGALSFVMKEGRPVVGTTGGPTRRESQCRFCGACVEVCPTGALADRVRVPGADRERALVPCRASCPAGIDIPRFVRHIARRELAEAVAVVREKLPFAFAPSYVCFHPCETGCRRGSLDTPISICRLKRFVADADAGAWRARRKQRPPTGKKVAVVGSGPAGLCAAYYLAKQGHGVTVYEALEAPGGMLRVGIPSFRYPRALLAKDLEEIRSVGVGFRCGTALDGGAGLAALRRSHDAVFLAMGAHVSRTIALPGRELEGVHWGVEFLRAHAEGKIPDDFFRGRRVLVIGGGNVAVDAARVARRLGSESVCVVSLEALADLPAYDVEVEEAREEGIDFLPTWGPREIVGAGGRPASVVLERCTRVFDAQGRFDPQFDAAEKREEQAGAVILAIGQAPSSASFEACGLGPGGTLAVRAADLSTHLPGVYAGGDVVTGPRSVIEAVAMGRRAASAIDRALGGEGDIDETLIEDEPTRPALGKVEGFAALGRVAPRKRPAAERVGSCVLVEGGLCEEEAVVEASRCLRCDLRLDIAAVPPPPGREEFRELTAENAASVVDSEGVYTLLDQDKNVIAIRGVMNLRQALSSVAAENERARFFVYELEPMYSRRESELLQEYVQAHGAMPGGGGDVDLDDLF